MESIEQSYICIMQYVVRTKCTDMKHGKIVDRERLLLTSCFERRLLQSVQFHAIATLKTLHSGGSKDTDEDEAEEEQNDIQLLLLLSKCWEHQDSTLMR